MKAEPGGREWPWLMRFGLNSSRSRPQRYKSESTPSEVGGGLPRTTQRSLRVLWLGTYERDYPRNRVLISGLRELGATVIECHEPLWERTRHKAGSFLSPRRLPRTALQYVGCWARLLARERRIGPIDVVVAGYPGQLDALPASLVARRRRVPFVLDALISFSDTLAGDRDRVGGAARSALVCLDRLTVRADLVVVDTRAQAELFGELGVPGPRIAVVPVGAEADAFPRTREADGTPRALFYGKLSPLHGLETILAAARRPHAPPVRLIGDGQLGSWLEAELLADAPPGCSWRRWVPYENLGEELAAAAICLGVFGTSRKARSVVPNKVFQAMAVGRAIVTADTPPVREVLSDGRNAVLVPPGDPDALADALVMLASDRDLRMRLGEAAYRRYAEVGSPMSVASHLDRALRPLLAG